MRFLAMTILLSVALAVTAATIWAGGGRKLPPLKRQPTPEAVVDEHLDALNKCSWRRLMAQYPTQVEIHLPDAVVVKGRRAVGNLFEGFCKTRANGGLRGLKFTTEKSFKVGNTLNVQWRAEAPFLAEAYRGSDAYVTKDGLMYAQVSTFNGADLQFK